MQSKRLRWTLKIAAAVLVLNAWATAQGVVLPLYAAL